MDGVAIGWRVVSRALLAEVGGGTSGDRAIDGAETGDDGLPVAALLRIASKAVSTLVLGNEGRRG